jgi:hypothetical protein
MFDLPEAAHSVTELEADLPIEDRPWNLGLIVGPSGCGKSNLARQLWPECRAMQDWLPAHEPGASILDLFPVDIPINEVTGLLCSVGFSSPPAWLRPFHCLSTGQQFRTRLALLLARHPNLVVFDEFTSVVDRTVARIGSAALARTVRKRGQQFVAVTCHEDVEPWLNPDWVYRPAERTFAWRELCRRPAIELAIVRCRASAWPLFAPHHHLSADLSTSAVCFLATWEGLPVVFSSWIHHVGLGPPTKREHRTVTLPNYQGVGLGNAVSDFCASLWKGLGFRVRSTTTHPAMILSRYRSKNWRMVRAPAYSWAKERKASLTHIKHAHTRVTAGFEYVGEGQEEAVARALLV